MEDHTHIHSAESKFKIYQPLIVILTLILFSALAIQLFNHQP